MTNKFFDPQPGVPANRTCGDFDAYAAYLRVSKFEAVKKFEYVLLHSSSKLEFDDRLAR